MGGTLKQAPAKAADTGRAAEGFVKLGAEGNLLDFETAARYLCTTPRDTRAQGLANPSTGGGQSRTVRPFRYSGPGRFYCSEPRAGFSSCPPTSNRAVELLVARGRTLGRSRSMVAGASEAHIGGCTCARTRLPERRTTRARGAAPRSRRS